MNATRASDYNLGTLVTVGVRSDGQRVSVAIVGKSVEDLRFAFHCLSPGAEFKAGLVQQVNLTKAERCS